MTDQQKKQVAKVVARRSWAFWRWPDLIRSQEIQLRVELQEQEALRQSYHDLLSRNKAMNELVCELQQSARGALEALTAVREREMALNDKLAACESRAEQLAANLTEEETDLLHANLESSTLRAQLAKAEVEIERAALELRGERSNHAESKSRLLKLIEWIHATHRLSSPPQGIRALLSKAMKLMPLFLVLLPTLLLAQPPPPVLRNAWSTNLAGTPVQGFNNLSVTNLGSGTNWWFHSVRPETIARLIDVTNIASTFSGGGGDFNVNQFSATTVTNIKSAALLTNTITYSATNRSTLSNEVPLTVAGTNTQVADLTQWQGTLGTTIASVSSNGMLRAANGSISFPALTFHADTSQGFYRAAASRIGYAAGGSERLAFATVTGGGELLAESTGATETIGIGSVITAPDVKLWRDGPSIFSQRNGLISQTNRIFATITGGPSTTNAAWMERGYDAALGSHFIRTLADGTLQTSRNLYLTAGSTNPLFVLNTNRELYHLNIATNAIVRIGAGGIITTSIIGANLSLSADGTLSASGGGGGLFNTDQFSASATHTNIRSRPLITNIFNHGTLVVTNDGLTSASVDIDAGTAGQRWLIDPTVGSLNYFGSSGYIGLNSVPYFIFNGSLASVPTNFTTAGTNDAMWLKLSGGVPAGSILRTDSNTNVVAAVIGSGLAFDGTTLTATAGAGALFNINQFSASSTHTNIKDGAWLTNSRLWNFTTNMGNIFSELGSDVVVLNSGGLGSVSDSILGLGVNNTTRWSIESSANNYAITPAAANQGLGLTTDKIGHLFVVTNFATRVHIETEFALTNGAGAGRVLTDVTGTGVGTWQAAGGGGATVQTNTVFVSSTPATNLNFVAGTYLSFKATNASGDVSIQHDLTDANLTNWAKIPTNTFASVGVYRTIYFDAGAMVPNETLGAQFDTAQYGTPTNRMLDSYIFTEAVSNIVQFKVALPMEWDVGTVKWKLFYYSTNASATVTNVWEVNSRAISNDDPLDGDWGTAVTVTNWITATNDLLRTLATPAMTVGGSPTAEDLIWFRIRRLPAHSSDNDNGQIKLLGAWLQYLETTTEPAAW